MAGWERFGGGMCLDGFRRPRRKEKGSSGGIRLGERGGWILWEWDGMVLEERELTFLSV